MEAFARARNQLEPAAVGRGRPVPSGPVAERVLAVRTGPVNFFLYLADDGPLCFDGGLTRPWAAAALRRLGVAPGAPTHLFLTHSDPDHTGAVSLLRGAQLFLSADERPMVDGKRARLGPYHNRLGRSFRGLADGEVVSVGSTRVRTIAVPGHTPGSMAFLVDGWALFSGDAFKLVDGLARPLRRYINLDSEQQVRSMARLAQLQGVRLACTGHWGVTPEPDVALAAWR